MIREDAVLLRPRHYRPRGRRTAEQRDELASPNHSITSSARASSVGGISRPSACLEVDHHVLGRLLEGQIVSLLAAKDTINIRRGAAVLFNAIRAVVNQPPLVTKAARNRSPVSDAAQSSRWSAP
jgi:hypothetical protein